jgi:hypothetical protein
MFAFEADTSTQPFIATDGRFVVHFTDAMFSLSEDAATSVTIVRHPFLLAWRKFGRQPFTPIQIDPSICPVDTRNFRK